MSNNSRTFHFNDIEAKKMAQETSTDPETTTEPVETVINIDITTNKEIETESVNVYLMNSQMKRVILLKAFCFILSIVVSVIIIVYIGRRKKWRGF